MTYDLVAHLHRQRAFSERTFGPGHRTKGVLDHIRKELREIENAPTDLCEWIDVALLAFDGAWRAGYSADEIAAAFAAKQIRNEARQWPDWRTADPDKAIEHNRSEGRAMTDEPIEYEDEIECPECGGTGFLETGDVAYLFDVCPECDGSGTIAP